MEAFNSIIGAIGKYAPIAQLGMAGAGALNQFSLAGKEKAAMDRATYFSKHPEAINSLAAQFQKPLDTGLVKGTENVVNASLAEQGLSQAPGIQTQVLSQALAPYQQQSQQMAITEAFKALGLPIEALSAIQSTMKPDQLAQMLKGILPSQPATPSGPLPSDAGGWGDVGSSTGGGGGLTIPDIFKTGDTSSLGAI
jgi:hypothetical protein